MTPAEIVESLIKQCDDAITNGRREVVIQMRRRAKGERVRIVPGVMGKVVQWGDGTDRFQTVAFVNAVKLRSVLIADKRRSPEHSCPQKDGE